MAISIFSLSSLFLFFLCVQNANRIPIELTPNRSILTHDEQIEI